MRGILPPMAAAAVLIAAAAAAADPTPQPLGLVATSEGPVPLTCSDGRCLAELSAICLEEERPAPKPGTPYVLIDPAAVRLVFAHDGGRTSSRPAAPGEVALSSLRSFAAVEAIVPADLLARERATGMAIAIEAAAAAIPAHVDAARARNLAESAQSLRPVAAAHVDRGGPLADAARLAIGVVNAVPSRATGAEALTVARQVVGRGAASTLGRSIAMQHLELCRAYVSNRAAPSLRSCMADAHVGFMTRLNMNYWEALKTGS